MENVAGGQGLVLQQLSPYKSQFFIYLFITIHGNKNKNTKQKVKSEKPLEVRKRAIDSIRGNPPQDQSKNHISKSNYSSPGIS